MYCGDETGAYIGDVGSSTARFGYGGEDNPKYVVPSYSFGEHNIPMSPYSYHDDLKPIYRLAGSGREPIVDPNEFLKQGDMIENWDAYETVWTKSMQVTCARDRFKHTTGRINNNNKSDDETKPSSSTIASTPSQEHDRIMHPILATRPGCTHVMDDSTSNNSTNNKELERYTEFLMETVQAESCFVAPSPMLAAFSHGRQTAIVVDISASGTCVTPIVDGLVLQQAQRRNGRGGDWLSHVAWKALEEQDVTIQPRYALKQQYPKKKKLPTKKKQNAHMLQYGMRDVMFEFRTSPYVTLQTWRYGHYTTPFMTADDDDDEEEEGAGTATTGTESQEPESYELPDGTLINLETNRGHDFKRIPELLFTDDTPFLDNDTTDDDPSKIHPTLSNLPLHKLIHASIGAVGDTDLRKELCANILLTGGTSLLPNMEQRLSYELAGLICGSKCKLLASKFSVERQYAPWIGASVLTSLGSFQQLWLSRKEYDEYGASLAVQRFPS